jgi:hypothetical protein
MLWFVLCVGYILVLTLRQAGVKWWIIFSLSGHSALIIFLLVSLYVFAIFRGVGKGQKIEIEHPLTTTDYYTVLYIVAPFLGGLAGCIGMMGESRTGQFLLGIALGTLGTTFLVWVVVDPAAGVLEMLLPPVSRRHRAERLALEKAQREEKQRDRERLLEDVLAKEELARKGWREALKPQAEVLAELLTTSGIGYERAERKAIDIGADAWKMGGLSCMQQLRDMAIESCKKKYKDSMITDYISSWWNGIGNWRSPSLG